MVFEAVKMLPVLGEPTPAMVALFKKELGLGTQGLVPAGDQPVDHLCGL